MLTHRQTLFVSHYLQTGNAYQAAIKAGYSENYAKARSHELLENVGIKAAIENFKKEVMANTGVTIEQLVAELTKIAFSDIRNVVDDKKGLTVRDLSTIDENTAAAVSEISESDTKFGTIRKVKMHSKLDAIHKLMLHLGGYVTVNDIIDKLSPEQLEELSEKILAKSKSNENK